MTISRAQIIERLCDPGVIAVVRAQSRQQALPLARALVDAGLQAVEITMTTPQAVEAIAETARELGDAALIGVGTVLDSVTAEKAIAAGAQFVVSPVGKLELTSVAHAADKPVMLGAYTPSEIQTVHESDADFVKLFPAENLGAAYIKAVRAAMPHLRLVPTGGVNLENISEFFHAGCPAVGAGSSLLRKELLAGGRWDELSALAKKFVEAARRARLGR